MGVPRSRYWRCFPGCMNKKVASAAMKALGNDPNKVIGE
jgi:hypothetical protein